MEKNQKRLNFLPWIHRFVLVLVSIFVIAWAIYKYIFLRSNFDFTDILFIVLLIFCFLDSTITASKSALTDGQTGLANDDAFIIYTLRLSMKKQLYKYTAVVINLKNYKLVNRIAGSVGGDTFIALIRKDHLDDFLTFISEVKIKVDVLTNTIKGCEALVRWEKNGKIESPVEFIPALENSGLITKLDDYVLQQVCLDIVRWKTEGLHCVETLSQRAILKEMKCGIIQGYLYDKPLECKAFEEKLKNPVYKF